MRITPRMKFWNEGLSTIRRARSITFTSSCPAGVPDADRAYHRTPESLPALADGFEYHLRRTVRTSPTEDSP
jgi:hypothetical protein